jgi:transposase
MTLEEAGARIAELEEEVRVRDRLIEELQALVRRLNDEMRQQVETIQRRVTELEAQHQKDSRNSSKPPSSDGFGRRPRSQRGKSSKRSGGQPGHPGHTMQCVATPDAVITYRPTVCAHCQQAVTEVAGSVVEERQVHDVPPPTRLYVTAHQSIAVRCPHCGQETRGAFPSGIEPGVQYGPELRSYAVYLHHSQFLSLERTCEALEDLFGALVSEGAVVQWVQTAAARVTPTVERIGDLIATRKQMGGDETSIRVAGRLVWLHVASTRWLTHLAWHRKRGQTAMREIGIWPRFQGRAMHDRWASYDTFACQHRLCKAHLIRDLTFLAEAYQQTWAATLRDLLVAMHAAAQEWHAAGVVRMPADERATWLAQYFDLLRQGYAELPPATPIPKRRGKPKQHPAKNLWDVLLTRAEQILGFVEDTSEEFTNNQRERDIRMVKVHDKIAGGFRSDAGATAFCAVRSYLATLRKQGHRTFAAVRSIFQGTLIPVAWGLE